MKILTNPQAIKQKIQWLLEDNQCERVVIVAFVGENAITYLPNPEGLKLYCWPTIPGTNPNGLRKLRNANVDLNAVKQLHSKIYWSKNRGCVIGSANLSANALEDNKNIETCVYLSKGEVDLKTILSPLLLKSNKITNSDILKLERDFNTYFLKNPPQLKKVNKHSILFPEWYQNNKSDINIKLRYWDTEDEPPSDAKDKVKEQTGRTHFHDYIHADNPKSFQIGDWILELRESKTNNKLEVTELSWFIPNIYDETKDKKWKYDKYVWYQTGEILINEPFMINDEILLKSINKSLSGFVNVENTITKNNFPKTNFIKKIYSNYLELLQ